MAAPVDAKRELDLIEKVEWRILSASSDEQKLQGLLKVYLAPLLLKAGSEHVAVRNKVDSTLYAPLQYLSLIVPQTGHIHMPDHQQAYQGPKVRFTRYSARKPLHLG